MSPHDFEPIDGVQICKNCGLAVHPNGDRWFAGVKIKGKPLCDDSCKKEETE